MTDKVFFYNPPDVPLQVVFQDNDLLVLSKPAGLLSVPGKAIDHGDCLERRAQEAYPGARTVHRLDMATSGLIVMAMNAPALRHLGLQFERRHVHKTYIAQVYGHVTDDAGTVDLPLICDWPNRPRQKVCHENGRPAQTGWEVLARQEIKGVPVSRMALHPVTGRSHQLRVHMLSLGHPIVGDDFYAPADVVALTDRLQLHAESLSFYHPADGRRCNFTEPCPF